jgi:DNA polymerase
MKPQGQFKKGILNVTGFPFVEDDESGKYHQSSSGKYLQKAYRKLGIDLFEDCININAISCYIKEDRLPTSHEIDCCRRFVIQAIWDFKPKVVVLFGDVALQSVIGHRWKKELGTISKWRGWAIPDQDLGCFVCPVFAPDYVRASFGQWDSVTAENTVWMNDLRQVVNIVI